MLGERGGVTATFEEGQNLIEAHKAFWRKAIRTDILATLAEKNEWHSDDLLTLRVPADCKNVIGAAVGGLVKRGLMVETGERRKSAAPESHGRKSNVYRLTEQGRRAAATAQVNPVDNPAAETVRMSAISNPLVDAQYADAEIAKLDAVADAQTLFDAG